jgi:signal transduction histidine kinase
MIGCNKITEQREVTMRYFRVFFGVLFLLTVAAVSIQAADPRDDAAKLVQSAVTYYKLNGLEKTIDEVSNPKGAFNKGELYVFVYDLSATMLAHPNPKLVGQNLLELPDSTGKNFYRKEIVTTALKEGKGWVNYKYQNPKSKEVEDKSTYFEKIEDIIICCGIYKK